MVVTVRQEFQEKYPNQVMWNRQEKDDQVSPRTTPKCPF
jgi:hypothetical protein